MKPIITFKKLLNLAKQRKNLYYYYLLKKYRLCFSKNPKQNIFKANSITRLMKNKNSAHSTTSMFRWSFNLFYGYDKFNDKWIESHPGEISKMTTRLDQQQISLIRRKFNEWINLPLSKMVINKRQHTRLCRLKIYYAFEALLCSGMRIGELCNINWSLSPAQRFIKSQIDLSERAEIIINTEKTCKQREIYIPVECYKYFVEDNKKLSISIIGEGFRVFRQWAKFSFYWSAHSLRRTLATIMSEANIDIQTIAMVLGNTPRVVMEHYIISSIRNVDATDVANCLINGTIIKTSNMFFQNKWMSVMNHVNEFTHYSNRYAKTLYKRIETN